MTHTATEIAVALRRRAGAVAILDRHLLIEAADCIDRLSDAVEAMTRKGMATEALMREVRTEAHRHYLARAELQRQADRTSCELADARAEVVVLTEWAERAARGGADPAPPAPAVELPAGREPSTPPEAMGEDPDALFAAQLAASGLDPADKARIEDLLRVRKGGGTLHEARAHSGLSVGQAATLATQRGVSITRLELLALEDGGLTPTPEQSRVLMEIYDIAGFILVSEPKAVPGE